MDPFRVSLRDTGAYANLPAREVCGVARSVSCETSSVNCVILQPSYIPWRGYFHQIQKADIFVFLDDVQFDRHGWRNRNRIKTSHGIQWLTIPVVSKNAVVLGTPIHHIPICWDRPWSQTHWSTLCLAYKKAPYFHRYAPLLEKVYATHPNLLADFTVELTLLLAQELGLRGRQFIRSSHLGVKGEKTDRLLAIIQRVGASHYISGPSAKDYLEPAKFEAAGVGLEYIEYTYPEYEQLYPPYDRQISILDLLFMKGSSAPEFIW